MPVQLSDDEIAGLLQEPKPVDANIRSRLQPRPKRGHRERELDLQGREGHAFRVIVRQSLINALDFSVILAFCPEESTQVFRLRRYNGKSHGHTNRLEGVTFYDFHIHTATARYQSSGLREDAFAEPTTRFASLDGAFQCLLRDCGFEVQQGPQGALFSEE